MQVTEEGMGDLELVVMMVLECLRHWQGLDPCQPLDEWCERDLCGRIHLETS